MAAIFEHSETLTLDPKPGFVVKTRILEGQGEHFYGTKVFINVCHEPRTPKPSIDFDPAVVFPMIVQNTWEIPIIVSLEKRAVDKKGVPSFVYDCCINKWALESVEMMHEMVLEREYTLPKMMCKGELSQTEITAEDLKNGLQKKLLELKQNETAGLIEELEGRRLGGSGVPTDDVGSENLPDLTDIGGKRHRPLIQEIGEMSLDESPKETGVTGKVNEDKAKECVLPSTDVKNSSENAKIASSTPDVVKYRFTITQKTQGDHFHVLFESPQLTKNMEVSFTKTDRGQGIITFKNVDSERSLDVGNRVEIPVPVTFTPYRSFLLENAGQLYVFCKKEN